MFIYLFIGFIVFLLSRDYLARELDLSSDPLELTVLTFFVICVWPVVIVIKLADKMP